MKFTQREKNQIQLNKAWEELNQLKLTIRQLDLCYSKVSKASANTANKHSLTKALNDSATQNRIEKIDAENKMKLLEETVQSMQKEIIMAKPLTTIITKEMFIETVCSWTDRGEENAAMLWDKWRDRLQEDMTELCEDSVMRILEGLIDADMATRQAKRERERKSK